MFKFVILGAAHPHVLGIAHHALTHAGAVLAGVYEPDPNCRQKAASTLGDVRFLDTPQQALDAGAQLALIGALPRDRAKLAREAVAAGVPALVDKPLALTHQALDQLVEAVQRHGKPILAYYPFRGYPQLRAAKAALEAGRIGQLVRVFTSGPHKINASQRPDWHWTREGNGGALIDIGSHHADLCCWFTGEEPVWISASHTNLTQPNHPEFQDFAHATLRFPSGRLAHFEVDWLNPASTKSFGDSRIWLQGSTGKIEIRLGDANTVHIWTEQAAQEPLDFSDYEDLADWSAKLMADLVAGRPTPISQEEVWRASRVSLAAFDSAQQQGQPVAPLAAAG